MNWHVFGKAFLCETLYSIPFFILALFPFRKQLRFSLKRKALRFSFFWDSCSSHPAMCILLRTENLPG